MRDRLFIAVYILTNAPHGTLYVGVTSNLYERVRQHRDGTFKGFTSEHGLKRLVWYQPFDSITAAIRREKSLKRYLRDWKINLIEQDNPNWDDLSLQWDRDPVWRPPGET